MRSVVFYLVMSVTMVTAQYACICSLSDGITVHASKSSSSSSLGTLDRGDCKAAADGSTTDHRWFDIIFLHTIGHVEKSSMVTLNTCLGQTSSQDALTTPTTTIATTPTTTIATTATTTSVISGHVELCPVNARQIALQTRGYMSQYSSSCYVIVPRYNTWAEAGSICRLQGGNLVTISSSAEQDFIYNFVNHNGRHSVWTGLNDFIMEGHFVWISGEHVQYTNWAPNRNTLNNYMEDCVAMYPNIHGAWDDIPCAQTHMFICEFRTSSGSSIIG